MALIVLGRKDYDFPDSKTGQQVTGTKLHCMEEFATPENGTLTEIIGAKVQYPLYQKLRTIKFGSVIVPVYNKYGSCVDVIIQQEPEESKK